MDIDLSKVLYILTSSIVSTSLGFLVYFFRKLIEETRQLRIEIVSINATIKPILDDIKLVREHEKDIAVLKSELAHGYTKNSSSSVKTKMREGENIAVASGRDYHARIKL